MTDMDKEWVSPSEETSEALKKEILKTMFPIIKPIAEEEDDKISMRRILTAIQQGKQLEKEADQAFEEANPNNKAHGHHPDIMSIAATCIAALVMGEDSVDGFAPTCVAGLPIICFANAVAILQAASNLESALDCELNDFGLDTAMKLIE